MTYQQLTQQSNLFHQRYSYSFSTFIHGMSQGSQLSLNDCKILNAMETLQLVSDNNNFILGKCAFISVPPTMTENNAPIIGRNYDYPPPFDVIAKYLTISILHQPNKVTTSIIAMPGQIYCPSCLNEKGIFMELNNGFASGGLRIEYERETLLIKMLEVLQNSETMNEVKVKMNSFQSDYSLIINVNGPNNDGMSYEYSSSLGMKLNEMYNDETYVSTNFFLNSNWNDSIPVANDENTPWNAVTRRNNLMNLTKDLNSVNMDDMKEIMNVEIENGGAYHVHTIYQIIFDTYTSSLLVRNRHQINWQFVDLREFW
eukprot:186972_1